MDVVATKEVAFNKEFEVGKTVHLTHDDITKLALIGGITYAIKKWQKAGKKEETSR